MTRLLLITESANRDLRQAWNSLAREDEDRADALLDQLNSAAQHLLEWPELGRPRPELADGLRCLVVGTYLILYIVRPNVLEIVRIVHGRRDVEALFE